jgi:hypothetical protein
MNLRLTVAAAVATILASVALYPLIATGTWFWHGVGVVTVVAVVGVATRLRPLPAIVCFPATLAGEFLYLNAAFAPRQSFARLIPTGASVDHLGRLVSQWSSEMSRYAPPVPGVAGLMFLTVAGIGLVAAITDLLAVRLRKPALAGLPMLVLFCVPLTTDAKTPWIGTTLVFCAGVTGYLGLLSAEGRDRLRLWGRLVHPWHGETESYSPDTRPLAATGRRIGFAAVVIALCLPLLVPGMKQHKLFPSTGSGDSHGYHGQISLPDPVALLTQQLHESRAQTVLTYKTTDNQPPYLQVYVLGRLTTQAWSLGRSSSTTPLGKGNMPPVPGLADSTYGITVHESLHLSSTLTSNRNVSYLPLPYAARTVDVSGSNWQVDHGSLTVLASGAHLGGLNYSVVSKDVNPSPEQLRAAPLPPASLAGYLFVPGPFDRLTSLANRITKGHSTLYGKALALQNWFTRTGNFTYSLKATQTRDADALWQFLTKTKRGYCQQFAFAMAVLARLVHIPSRVAVGYTQGTYLQNNTWLVKTSDAHAWPELYFAGAGWLRFEPTPIELPGQRGQQTANSPQYTLPLVPGGPPTVPFTTPTGANPGTALPTSSPTATGILGKVGNNPQGGSFSSAGKKRATDPRPIGLVVLAVLAVLLLAPRAIRSVTRRLRWLRAADPVSRAHAAWREIRDDLADHRLTCQLSESPRALVVRVSQVLHLAGPQHDALTRIARAEERATYASSPGQTGTLRADVTEVRHAIAKASPMSARVAALLMPASALAPIRSALQHALDIFGWLDMIAPRLRRNHTPAQREEPALSWRP